MQGHANTALIALGLHLYRAFSHTSTQWWVQILRIFSKRSFVFVQTKTIHIPNCLRQATAYLLSSWQFKCTYLVTRTRYRQAICGGRERRFSSLKQCFTHISYCKHSILKRRLKSNISKPHIFRNELRTFSIEWGRSNCQATEEL